MDNTIDIRQNLNNFTESGGSVIQYDLGTIIGSFINVAILVGALAMLLFMVLGAIGWITAGGDTGKIEKARTRFIQSIVGFAVVACTWAVFLIVQYFFGINISGGIGGAGRSPSSGSSTAVCTVGQVATAGRVGNYCNGGSAQVKCVGAGQGASSHINEAHWEPCGCNSGTPRAGVTFLPGGC